MITAYVLILMGWTGPLAFTPDVTCGTVSSETWPLGQAKATEPTRAASSVKANSEGVPVRSRARHVSPDTVECAPFWSAETCTDALALVNGGGVRAVCVGREWKP